MENKVVEPVPGLWNISVTHKRSLPSVWLPFIILLCWLRNIYLPYLNADFPNLC